MANDSTSKYIEHIKKHFGVETDEELAVAIGVKKSTIASWRRRGSIPKRIRQDLHVWHGVDFDRLARGRPDDKQLSDMLVDAAFYFAILRLGRDLDEEQIKEYASWLGDYAYRVRMLVVSPLKADDLISNDPAHFTKLFMDVITNTHATVEQIKALRAADPYDDAMKDTRGFPT